jgi:hypothetical protein
VGVGPFLVAVLGADATVSSHVGTDIFDCSAIQDTQPPYIVFEEFDGERFHQMGTDANIVDARVRLHLWHTTVPNRDALADAVRKVLQRFSGTAGGVQVDDVLIEPGGPNFYDAQLRAWHAVRDYRVIYRESGPAEV